MVYKEGTDSSSPLQKITIIKRWSVAESFTIFENHVYRIKKNLMFAGNFEATPFLGESFFF